jgi:hypothetical protein
VAAITIIAMIQPMVPASLLLLIQFSSRNEDYRFNLLNLPTIYRLSIQYTI